MGRIGFAVKAAAFAALALFLVSGTSRGAVSPSYGGNLHVDSPVRLSLRAKGTLAGWSWLSARGASERMDDGTWRVRLGAAKDPSVMVVFRASPLPDRATEAVWSFTPEADVRLAFLGVSFALRTEDYGGGTLMADGEAETLPETGSAKEILRPGVSRLELTDKTGGRRLSFAFREPVDVLMQYWGVRTMELRFCLPPDDPATALFRGGVERRVAFALDGAGAFVPEPESPIEITADSEWIPLDVPDSIIEGSAIDFSEMRPSGKPAGAFGRVVARGPHFEFEKLPGVQQRFYGANLCFGACYPETPEQARDIARLLARSGYNAARIHHHDGRCVDAPDSARTRLDEGMMRRMDALVAACAAEGIYITTDLFVSRDQAGIPWRAIGVERDGNMSMKDVKWTVPVHEGAYSNFLAFAANWLCRTNSVTGVRYADDPAIAWISLVNEGNIDGSQPRQPGWAEAWEAWLAEKKAADPEAWADIPATIPKSFRDRHGRAFLVFQQDVETRFFRRTREFLRSLGCKALLTDMNDGWTCKAALLKTRAEAFDYMDSHYYIDHPGFLERPWMLPMTCRNENPFLGKSYGAPPVAVSRILDKPFTVTEYNYCGPGRYRGVAGLAAGAAASLQDWAGVWRFAWESDARAAAKLGSKPAYAWNNASDPLQLATDRAAVCLFLRGDALPLERTYAVTLPQKRISSPDAGIDADAVVDWGLAEWRAKVGSVLGAIPPDGAVHAGDFDVAFAKSSDEVCHDLGLESGRVVSTKRPQEVVRIDSERGAFSVATPRTCGGFAEGGALDCGALRFEIVSGKNSRRVAESAEKNLDLPLMDNGEHLEFVNNSPATPTTVWASSLDGKPLSDSSRILVTHLTDLQNTGARFADTLRSILLDWGRLPYLMRAGKAEVELRLDSPAKVFALSPSGRRVREVTTTFDAARSKNSPHHCGVLRFTADVAADPANATFLYEIVRTTADEGRQP
ncbi:MAG: hypothetical protein ILM98_01380 [Kiritimatiellae bacterium]|nr:hypothetical protein [Kiritimatiellia bacterium]